PDMERGFRAAEQLDEVLKLRVTARIAPPADRDPLDLALPGLEACEGLVRDAPEILEPGILLLHAPGAVVAPFLERQAVLATKGLHPPDFFEITVFAETAAADTRAAPDIHGQLGHLYTLVCAGGYKIFVSVFCYTGSAGEFVNLRITGGNLPLWAPSFLPSNDKIVWRLSGLVGR